MLVNRQALKNTIQEQMMIHRRMVLAIAIMFGLISIIVSRFAYLQISEYEVYSTKADSNRVHLSKIAPNALGLNTSASIRMISSRPTTSAPISLAKSFA